LHLPENSANATEAMAEAVHAAVDCSYIRTLPEHRPRKSLNRPNDQRSIYFIDVVFMID
jgi:hypothetical protein